MDSYTVYIFPTENFTNIMKLETINLEDIAFLRIFEEFSFFVWKLIIWKDDESCRYCL